MEFGLETFSCPVYNTPAIRDSDILRGLEATCEIEQNCPALALHACGTC
jgi:hypothetical protein